MRKWRGTIVGRWEFEESFEVVAPTEGEAREIALEEARAALPWGAGDADVSITSIKEEEA